MSSWLRAWRAHGLHPIRSALGAAIGIGGAAVIGLVAGTRLGTPMLAAPLGASATLAFAVPASPLAQPRAIIFGNTLCALVGIGVMAALPAAPVMLQAVVAVGLAVLAMHLAGCLHPPGGGVALLPVLGGAAASRLGFAFVPVALNSAVLVAVAWAFNNIAGSRYPHRPEALPEHKRPPMPEYHRADLDAVLEELEDLPDIDPDDLDAIFRAVSARMQAGRA